MVRVLTSQHDSSSVLTSAPDEQEQQQHAEAAASNSADSTGNAHQPLASSDSTGHSKALPLPRSGVTAITMPRVAVAVGGTHVAVVCSLTGEVAFYAWHAASLPGHSSKQHQAASRAAHGVAHGTILAAPSTSSPQALEAIAQYASSVRVCISDLLIVSCKKKKGKKERKKSVVY